MIEDKKLGLKIAESDTEALWTRQKTAIEAEIKNLENLLIVNKEFLKTCKTMLRPFKKKSI